MSKLEESKINELIKFAVDARKFSYAPYSKFKVGAALLCNDGRIFTGCNVENAAYSPGNCAERTAVFKAVSEGCTNFNAIAIIGGAGVTSPCGMCRQVLREFVNPEEFEVIMVDNSKESGSNLRYEYTIMTLEELLPLSFGPDNLNREYME